jgi:TonB family protein
LHLLILLFFFVSFKKIILPPHHAKEHKISLNLQQITTPPLSKPKPIPQPVIEPIVEKVVTPEPKVQKIKKKILDESKKVFAKKSIEENNVTKVELKPKEKIAKKKVIKKKKRVVKKKKTYRKPKRSKDPLANMLMGSGSSLFSKKSPSSQSNNYNQKMITSLYGSEFNTFNPTQKKFIRRNLSTIHKITQRTLTRNGYPEGARRTRQQGTNIVSFYLHSNGDISNLRLKRPIGYTTLDENTLKVIRIAYKDYPLPNKKTKIIFYVNYRIY